ncbi:MAG: hypothetical protein GX625_17205 [Clostridiaceae bacterium]|nr:hypothetical protein [Clostridiaceae bacterium]
MSLSNEWSEFHLTPAGWVSGSEKIDFAGIKEAPIPEDRVLTIHCREYQSCSFAKAEYWREEVWRSDDAASVKALVDEFGSCPKEYLDWPASRGG